MKLTQLTKEELAEFEKAKASEANNCSFYTQEQYSELFVPEQILRCRWIQAWKLIEDPAGQAKQGGETRKLKPRSSWLIYGSRLRKYPTRLTDLRLTIPDVNSPVDCVKVPYVMCDIKAAFEPTR